MTRVLSICLLLLLVAGFALAQQSQPAAPAEAQGAWMKTVTLKGEDTLSVYVDPGDVLLQPSDTKDLVIKVQKLPKEELGRVQLTQAEKTVKLDYRGAKTMVGTFVIQVPASLNLDIYAGSNVEARGTLSGKIRIRANAGTVTLGDVDGGLTVEATGSDVSVANVKGSASISTNGDIEVQDVTGDLDLKNRSGDSFAKSVGGNLNAKSEDGDISVGTVTGNATVLAGIGDVDLRKAGGVVTMTTDGGDIDLFEVPSMAVVSSTSGEITLRKVSGAVDAKTEDGDITAEMYAGSGGSSKFFSRDGDIALYFPDTAKATVDAKFHLGTAAGGTKEDAKDEAEDVVTSDWPALNSQKQGADVINKYEIGGGGDAILVEATNGELLFKKLTPKPQPKPAPSTQNPNQPH